MKLKRFVSAILAVGMALTMLPTAAFAANATITGIKLDGNGFVDGSASGGTQKADTNGNVSWEGAGWRLTSTGAFVISGNTDTFNEASASGMTINSKVFNYGVISGGSFGGNSSNAVTNYGSITGGIFSNVKNLRIKEDFDKSGWVEDAIIQNYLVSRLTTETGTTVLKNSIVWGNISIDNTINNTITDSIVSNIPDSVKDQYQPQVLTAEGGFIQPDVTGIPSDVVYNGKVYLIGNPTFNNAEVRTFKVTPASKAFEKWDLSGAGDATIDENPQTHVLTVTVPANGDVTIKAVASKVPLEVGTVDGKKVPVYNGELYQGCDFDGWYFDTKTETLTVYENGSVDIGNVEIDWNVENEGEIKGGIFDCQDETDSVLQNKEGGKITGGIFNVKVSNKGIIEGGVFNRTVNNYKTVNNGIFTARYYNTATRVDVAGGKTEITDIGVTNGGVFSRYADFYGQDDIKYSKVTLNNCTANGISGLVNVVGNQTLKIEADATSWTGWEVTADPAYEDAINKQVGNTSSFDLTLNGDDEWSVTLTAQVKEGYYRMNLTDGTATNADGTEITSAKAGDTVKLTAADAPDGMVFDRWEITPSDVALTLEEAGFDSHAATASFKMPAQTLNIRAMYRMADQPEELNVLGTVAMVATAGVGAAVVGYTGYMIGTELYLNTVLPEGTAIPNNTTELAKLLWTDAGQPAPAAVLAADATDEQKALTWAVENRLISADKAADASVGRWEVIDAWNKAQEMKKV